jgi:hypothetical protein
MHYSVRHRSHLASHENGAILSTELHTETAQQQAVLRSPGPAKATLAIRSEARQKY